MHSAILPSQAHPGIVKSTSQVFDCDIETSITRLTTPNPSTLEHQLAIYNALIEVFTPNGEFEHQLLQHVRDSTESLAAEDIESLAADLLSAGYQVQIRAERSSSARGAAAGSSLQNLSHRFMTCTGYIPPHPADEGSRVLLRRPVIVETRFKEQFEMADPDKDYEALLSVRPWRRERDSSSSCEANRHGWHSLTLFCPSYSVLHALSLPYPFTLSSVQQVVPDHFIGTAPRLEQAVTVRVRKAGTVRGWLQAAKL